MSHPIHHAKFSAHRYGGNFQEYLPIHEWFDATKESFCDFRHRALRHHAEGIFEAQRVFGPYIVNSEGKEVPVRNVATDHVRQDCGGIIPSVADWLRRIEPASWMSRGYLPDERIMMEIEGKQQRG